MLTKQFELKLGNQCKIGKQFYEILQKNYTGEQKKARKVDRCTFGQKIMTQKIYHILTGLHLFHLCNKFFNHNFHRIKFFLVLLNFKKFLACVVVFIVHSCILVSQFCFFIYSTANRQITATLKLIL